MKKKPMFLAIGLLLLAAVFAALVPRDKADNKVPAEDFLETESEQTEIEEIRQTEQSEQSREDAQKQGVIEQESSNHQEEGSLTLEKDNQPSGEPDREKEESGTEESSGAQQPDEVVENETTNEKPDADDERIEIAIEEGLPKIVVSAVEAKQGDTVKVTATLVNNPGVLGMALTLAYEESVLELTDVQNGEAVNEVLTMSHSKELASGCVFLWDGEEILPEQVKDGIILNLEFKVLEHASLGSKPITIICSKDGTVNNQLQIVDIGVENGYIKIIE